MAEKKSMKKYELGTQFCAERLMLINGALDASKKMDEDDPAVEALKRLASLWAIDLVDGEFEEEPEAPPTADDICSALIEEMGGNIPATITSLAHKVGVSVKEVRPALQRLIKEGVVRSEGEKRSKVYFLSSN